VEKPSYSLLPALSQLALHRILYVSYLYRSLGRDYVIILALSKSDPDKIPEENLCKVRMTLFPNNDEL
jgi:hypothetical protein